MSKSGLDTPVDSDTLSRPHCFPQNWSCLRIPKLGLHTVKMAYLTQDKASLPVRLFLRLVKLAPCMSPASSQGNGTSVLPGKAPIGTIGITLDRASKVHGNDVFQTGRTSTGFPPEEDISSRSTCRPKITQLGLTMTGTQIAHRRLMLRPPGLRTLSGCLKAVYVAAPCDSMHQPEHTPQREPPLP